MDLRRRLAALSLMTLLLPVAGWLLVQEVERFMREGQADSLRATARAVAATLPDNEPTGKAGVPLDVIPLNEFLAPPQLDGYADEWPDEALAPLPGGDGVRWAAGRRGNRLYLWLDVDDADPVRDAPGADSADQLRLVLTTPNGLVSYRIAAAAPGRFVVPGQ
ncbi:MAG: histidine kinase, partial [Xanthomonadales bacterium]|nr:histidine kinase [Xanthomonadales bacterium]